MIIGGAQVFRESIPLAERIYLTKIHHVFQSDVFFPKLHADAWAFRVLREHPQDLKNPYAMTFCVYDALDKMPTA
jgi:dihydrofolate reductase